MRALLLALSLAAGVALFCGQGAFFGAQAYPIDAAAIQHSARTATDIERVQFYGWRGRHSVVKCYRTLVIGHYRCHRFYR
jgi:hypothetical protein